MVNQAQNHIKAILFDIGGTLIQKDNLAQRDLAVIQQIADRLGANATPEVLLQTIQAGEEEYRLWRMHTFVELPLTDKWQRFFLKDYPADLVRDHAETFQALWRQSRGKRWIAPRAIDTLKELSARGYTLATVSHTTPEPLQNLEDDHLFRTHLHATEYGKRKPHPSIFLEAAHACEALPAECAYVGDRPSRDVIGSREAGMGKVILVENEYSTHESEPCPMQADAVINDITQLLDLFQPLSGNGRKPYNSTDVPALYDAALSTINWNREHMTLNQFLDIGRELGFARFELNHQIPQEVFDQIDFNRFSIGGLHNPCPAVSPMKELEAEDRLLTSLDEKLRQSGMDVLKSTIETAWRLGARNVVIHSGWVVGNNIQDRTLWQLFEEGKQHTPEYSELKHKIIADRSERGKPHLEQLIKSYAEIVKFAKGTNLMLGIENLMHYYELPNFEEMHILMDTFTQPWIGWQLDTGHLQIQQNIGLDSMQTWLEAFGDRMVGIHLHDVIGITDHLAPGCGCIDFEAIAAKLQPFTQITLEVKPVVTIKEIQTSLPFLEQTGCIKKL